MLHVFKKVAEYTIRRTLEAGLTLDGLAKWPVLRAPLSDEQCRELAKTTPFCFRDIRHYFPLEASPNDCARVGFEAAKITAAEMMRAECGFKGAPACTPDTCECEARAAAIMDLTP